MSRGHPASPPPPGSVRVYVDARSSADGQGHWITVRKSFFHKRCHIGPKSPQRMKTPKQASPFRHRWVDPINRMISQMRSCADDN